MKPFWKALQVYFRDTPHSAFYSAVEGRLFPDVAPQNTDMPYAVISSPGGFPSYDLEGNPDETITVQFDLYAEDESGVQDAFDGLKEHFDNCSFLVAGYQITGFKRVMNHKITEDDLKRYIIQYTVNIGVF